MSHVVEFTGGPLDGYEHTLPAPVDELAGTVGLEVNQNVVRALSGEGSCEEPIGSPTSIAVYRLEEFSDPPRYQFVCAVPVDVVQPEDAYPRHARGSRISGQ